MAERGKYIYGILNSNTSLHLSIPKDLLLPPHQLQYSGGETRNWCGGKSNGAVYTIPHQDISALVKDSEIVDGSTTLTINPERVKRGERVDYTHIRKDILARLLVDHQTVIERVMTAQTTIVPMRLGTFACDETEVRDILSKGYNLIKELFERISDKIEIDIVAGWGDFNSILKEVGEEPEIKELKERLQSNHKEITVDEQMKIGVMVKSALDKKNKAYAEKIHESLKDIKCDSRPHELMDGKMVVNTAYLIDKTRHKELERIIERLNTEFNERLNFRCVGPLPPYSFYTLEVKKIQYGEIDWARKRLDILDSSITQDEIKKAYHRQAFTFHPDKNPERLNSEVEFNEVNKAYNILLDYCQACKQSGQLNSCSFDENEFKENVILVKVRE